MMSRRNGIDRLLQVVLRQARVCHGRAGILPEIEADEVVGLVKRLIEIPNHTREERPGAKFLGRFLKENGRESRLMETDPGRPR
jgi:hypothetical protein